MPKSQQTLRLTLNRNLPERQGVENDFQVKKTPLLKEKDLVSRTNLRIRGRFNAAEEQDGGARGVRWVGEDGKWEEGKQTDWEGPH